MRVRVYTWKNKSAEFARILNVSDAVQSIRSLYKLLSSYDDDDDDDDDDELFLSYGWPAKGI